MAIEITRAQQEQLYARWLKLENPNREFVFSTLYGRVMGEYFNEAGKQFAKVFFEKVDDIVSEYERM